MRIPRRNFLKAAGVSLALPLMHSLGCSRRDAPATGTLGRSAGGFPRRLVIVYIPNGNLELPGDMEFAGSMLEPLAPYRDKMLVLSGLDMSVHNIPPGEPHQQGMAFLTGRSLNNGTMVGGDGTLAGWASGISVDQVIAEQVGATTPHKSLHFGVQSTIYGGTEVRTVMSYRGSDAPNANDDSPWSMFDLAFSDISSDPLGLAKLKARRASVLDAVGGQIERVSPNLGNFDRQKLEQHLTSVREVEQRLSNPGGEVGGFCQVPSLGSRFEFQQPGNYGRVGGLQMDLLAMALACDLTRVATLQWSASTNNRPYPFLTYDDGGGAGPQPITDDEHGLGHQPFSEVHAWGKLRVIRRWYMEQLAYLLGKLDSITEGDGTMLDNTVVVLGSEIAYGNSHSHMDAPFLIAGSGGGYFATGRRLHFDDTYHNDLLVTLLNSMGIEATTFGNAEYCSGALPGLTG